MTNVLIVGGGLFGSFAAILAAKAGHNVTVFDDGREFAGSKPAACLMKPSWMSGLGEIGREGLKIVDETFGLRVIPFRFAGATVDVFWVDPAEIFREAARVSRLVVEPVREAGDGWLDMEYAQRRPGGTVLIAAGVWSFDLLRSYFWPVGKKPVMKSLVGAAFTFSGKPKEPTIRVWAPYKQLVSFEREPGTTWVGDGSAILAKNWTAERQADSLLRCSHFVFPAPLPGQVPLLKTQVGYRPYVEGYKAGYFAQLAPKLFVSTGGAKNGTVLAAYYAKKFVEAL